MMVPCRLGPVVVNACGIGFCTRGVYMSMPNSSLKTWNRLLVSEGLMRNKLRISSGHWDKKGEIVLKIATESYRKHVYNLDAISCCDVSLS